MPLKERTEPKELIILRSLNTRMELSANDKQYYLNLKKGYEGEVLFDKLTAQLDSKFYIINDLLLKHNHTEFQIDTLIITQKSLIPCEVKNYEGDYYYENDNFYSSITRKPISNPLHQMNRCETLLRQLTQKHGFHLPVEGHLIFVNPEFFLFQTPQNKNIVNPPQLNRFLKELSSKPSNLNGMHRKLADFLLNEHNRESSFTQLPKYNFNQIRKGEYCASCNSFLITIGDKKIVCDVCGFEETIESAVVRIIEELRLLFPDIKITANVVYEWCGLDAHRRKIRRILSKNYKIIGHGKYAYYVNK